MQSNTKNKKPISPHIQYRQDINGIRGIAILFVIISHGWWNALPSGKVGVDIFFVISGYLISSIVFKQRSKGVYTIWKFYSRRIKRLAPALVLFLGYMILFIPTSYFQNDKLRMRQEGSHIMASILMAENLEHIRMDFNNQYNSTVTTHLWSLGIQEQFYIFWPLVTGLIFKLNVKLGSIVIVGLACLSLWLQLHLQVVFYEWRTARFIPFARFWQFLVGCLLAYVQFKMKEDDNGQKNTYSQHQLLQQNDNINETKQFSSIIQQVDDLNDKNQTNDLEKSDEPQIAMENSDIMGYKESIKKEVVNKIQYFMFRVILHPIVRQIIPFICFIILIICGRARKQYPFINNRYIQHVGFTYVPTVLATAILIITKDSYFNRKILPNKIFQFFGDISYPLYLWHAGLQMLEKDQSYILLRIYSPALIVSWISMKYIEPFFRRNQQKWVIPFLILAQVAIFWRAYQIYTANL